MQKYKTGKMVVEKSTGDIGKVSHYENFGDFEVVFVNWDTGVDSGNCMFVSENDIREYSSELDQ